MASHVFRADNLSISISSIPLLFLQLLSIVVLSIVMPFIVMVSFLVVFFWPGYRVRRLVLCCKSISILVILRRGHKTLGIRSLKAAAHMRG